jgi:hypothetical protein
MLPRYCFWLLTNPGNIFYLKWGYWYRQTLWYLEDGYTGPFSGNLSASDAKIELPAGAECNRRTNVGTVVDIRILDRSRSSA